MHPAGPPPGPAGAAAPRLRAHRPAHAIVAHSAGCHAATLAVRGGLATDRLVFIAPMADLMPYARQFGHALGLGPRGWSRFLRRFTQLTGREPADVDLPAVASQAGPLPPLLVIHDRADKEARYTDGSAIAAAWPGATMLSTDGLGHRRILADPAVATATTSFVTGPAGSPARFAPAAGSIAGS